ncbi:MFS transporter [Streptomyces tricolor]|nr:MFS transporter [Streptomyces tricolor]
MSISTAGLLVAVYALTMAFGGPVVTLVTTRIERRTLMTGLLVVSVIGNIVSASASSYGVLVVGRIITAMIHGTFVAPVRGRGRVDGAEGEGRQRGGRHPARHQPGHGPRCSAGHLRGGSTSAGAPPSAPSRSWAWPPRPWCS